MIDEPKADLTLIARQQRQLLSEMNTLRDDMTVLTAIVQRLDGTLAGLVNEIRATHSLQSRLEASARKGRMFFSEEKNQKTFTPSLAEGSRPWPESWEAAEN